MDALRCLMEALERALIIYFGNSSGVIEAEDEAVKPLKP